MTQPTALEDEIDIPDANIGKACRELIAQNRKITIRAAAERTGVAHTTNRATRRARPRSRGPRRSGAWRGRSSARIAVRPSPTRASP